MFSTSETHRSTRDCYTFDGSGMKDVHSWLKSLRLHKYSDLFSRMTYDQMMSLTEEFLESQGVTKGARHKIILNINKLKNRVNNIKALIQSLDEEGCNFIRQALNELKTILNTPIKPYLSTFNSPKTNSTSSPDASPPPQTLQPARRRRRLGSSIDSQAPRCDCEDNIENQYSPFYQCNCHGSNLEDDELLPSYVTKVIEKIGSLFIYAQYADDECFKMLNVCTDKCLSHEAFSAAHKQRLCFWKQQVDALRYSLPGRRSMGTRQLKGQRKQCTMTALNAGQINSNNNNNHHHNHHNHHHPHTNFGNLSQSQYLHGHSMDSRRNQIVGQMNPTQPNSRFFHPFNQSLGFPGMERSITSSSSSSTTSPIPRSPNQINTESDPINTYIEKLCLRMTEQALGGAMDEDMDF